MQLFSLHGRSNRARYIWHTLLDGLVVAALLFLIFGGALGGLSMGGGPLTVLFAVLAAWMVLIAAFAAELCITVRRLHDLNRSGWQWLLSFVPFVNLYIWILLIFEPGTQGPNRYGPDPLN